MAPGRLTQELLGVGGLGVEGGGFVRAESHATSHASQAETEWLFGVEGPQPTPGQNWGLLGRRRGRLGGRRPAVAARWAG